MAVKKKISIFAVEVEVLRAYSVESRPLSEEGARAYAEVRRRMFKPL